MRVKGKSLDGDKQYVKVKQFKYEQGIKKSNMRSIIMSDMNDKQSPLKILAKKMSLQPQIEAKIKMGDTFLHTEYRHFLTPRDSLYEPKRYVFNRYNYENYENYEYKNPYKPKKYPIEDKKFQNLKNNPAKGTTKNLQIVFCQRKYKDFVQKSNVNFNKFCQTARQFPKFQSPKGQKSNHRINRHQSEPKIGPITFYQTKRRKTTLSKFLHQFVTLQKLSQYMQRQRRLNEKYLFISGSQNSKTVLLDVIVHRFQFLKRMKKKARDLIFRIILGEQNLSPITKIMQLFVSRDADISYVAMFTFSFIFPTGHISVEAALTSLNLLQNTVSKHQIVQSRLIPIVQSNQGDGQKVFQQMLKDQILLNYFIDLIVCNN